MDISSHFTSLNIRLAAANLKANFPNKHYAYHHIYIFRYKMFFVHNCLDRNITIYFLYILLKYFWLASGRTVALGLTQPLTEMSARNIFWG